MGEVEIASEIAPRSRRDRAEIGPRSRRDRAGIAPGSRLAAACERRVVVGALDHAEIVERFEGEDDGGVVRRLDALAQELARRLRHVYIGGGVSRRVVRAVRTVRAERGAILAHLFDPMA